MISILTRLLPHAARLALRRRLNVPDVEWSLGNLRRNGFRPTAIVDVGAYHGEWAELARRVFPEARVLMVEAQPDKAARLRERAATSGGRLAVASTLLGPAERDHAAFHINDTVSSALQEHHGTAAVTVELPMQTLDAVLAESGFPTPHLLKLDVQGFELEVLKGAHATLADPALEVVLMEVSLIDINKGAPLIREVLDWTGDRGFDLYDIGSVMRRPLDDALWQIDALLVRRGSALSTSKRWG